MRIKNIFSHKILLASIILVFFIIGLIGYFSFTHQINKKTASILNNSTSKKTQTTCEARRKLDGVCTEKSQENLWPVALMIDNHPDSWPQFGLSKAQVVYNTLVEGGATRLMAVFTTHEEIEKIGPVRSARPYYLTWAKELSAIYGHSGGSPEAIKKIKQYQIIDFEEATSYGPLYFGRDNKKTEPHNLFTSGENIAKARIDWELADKTSAFTLWQFSESADTTSEVATNIFINYSAGTLFDVEYKYNTTTRAYLRFQNGEPHLDGLTNEQIAVKNVIIQFVPKEIHLDSEDRLSINTLGSGQAWIFYEGKMTKGKWVKNSLEARTLFYDENNQEIIFKPGNIWLEVVPGERGVKVQ